MANSSPWFWRMWLRERTRYRPANWIGYIVLIGCILFVVGGMQLIFNPHVPGGVAVSVFGGIVCTFGIGFLVWACRNRSIDHPKHPHPS